MVFANSLRKCMVVQMAALLLCSQACDRRKSSSTASLSSRKNSVLDVLTMLEDSAFNQYKDSSIRLRRFSNGHNDKWFALQEDSVYNAIYIRRKIEPGFVQLNKTVRDDSSFLAKEFHSSMLLLALPAAFNAFSEDFVAVAFFDEDHGVLYSAYLKDSSVQRKTLSREAIRVIMAVNAMHPQSQEEMGSGGGYLAFVGSIIEGHAQSFIILNTIPYHVFDRSDFPEMSEERFTMLSATDSLIWTIATVVDPEFRLQRREQGAHGEN